MKEISFTSGRDRCAAWHFDANGDALAGARGVPCVVMAPGFAGTRDTSTLMDYARGFAAAGLDVVLFDYRGFGGSGGSPRQLVSVPRQRRDYRAAIAAARQLPGVDPERIVLWGVSYSGGHVVRVAAEDGRVAAVVAVTPAVDGVAVLAHLARSIGIRHLLRAAAHGMRDAQRTMTRRRPHLVPMVGEPGSRAIFAMDGAEQAYTEVAGPTWRNEVCARTALEVALNRPIRFAPRVRCPLLVQAGTADRVAPLGHRPSSVSQSRCQRGVARIPHRPRGRLHPARSSAALRRSARFLGPPPVSHRVQPGCEPQLAIKEALMKQRNVRLIETNGITLKVVVEGSGPLLLLLHGFPQSGYLWRNQIDDLVAAGYQVAVPDQRGYGGSDKPADPQAYDTITLSADAVGIADALGHDTFTLVTHDWGAIIGWYMASLYPQRVNAVFGLSVPPTVGTPVGALTRQENFGDNFVYTVYFQQPGVAEAELDADVRKSIRMLYYSVSGDAPEFGFMRPKPASSKMLDGLVDPDPLPGWLTEEDLDRYCEDYRDGFRGPINWYRSIDHGIELTRHLVGTKIMQPSHFMIGSLDPMNVLLWDPLANVEQNAPNLRRNVVVEGAGHWLPLERPKEVNAALLDFLAGLENTPQSVTKR